MSSSELDEHISDENTAELNVRTARSENAGKAHHTVANVPGQKQKHGQTPGHKTVLRRKTAVNTKPKVPTRVDPAALKQQQPQTVINRARGTLHGLSTIKRHGNVRVTPNADYLAV